MFVLTACIDNLLEYDSAFTLLGQLQLDKISILTYIISMSYINPGVAEPGSSTE